MTQPDTTVATLTIDELHASAEATVKAERTPRTRSERTAVRALMDATPEITPLLTGNLADPDVQDSIAKLFLKRSDKSETTTSSYIIYFKAAIRRALAAPDPDIVTCDNVSPNIVTRAHNQLVALADRGHFLDPHDGDGDSDEFIDVDIPIRDTLRIAIQLPIDLTGHEARRIARIITAYATTD